MMRSVQQIGRRLLLLTGALAALLLAAAPAGAFPASGRAAVTAPDEATPLGHGGSSTLFSVVVPTSAHCAGDSARDGYRLFSFLVPHGQSPRQVSFLTTVPSKWYGLYTETEYYAANLDPGTGQLMTPPSDLTFARLSAALLIPEGASSATWDGGYACVDEHFHVQNYWSAGFRFTRSTTDPRGFTWDVVDPAPPPSSGGSYWLGVLPFAVAAALVVAAVLLRRLERRRHRRPRTAA